MTQPLVVIVGPTGIGKTALSIEVAKHFGGEIVSTDSRQIYRFMDIGTAKPTQTQLAAVPHHLINIVNPDQPFTMAEYQTAAYTTITDIHQQGKLPFLVGGTGQYITAVLEGWSAPEVLPDPVLRTELETFAAEHGALALFDRLRTLDPVAAEQMDPFNARRTVRALEVCIISGKPFSDQRGKNPPPYHTLQLGLTIEREMLYVRLDERIDAMIAAGLLEEVRQLHEAGYAWNLPAMSGLGYAQLGAYLRGETSLAESIIAIKRDTRTFVRRQYTWFRKHGDIRWLDGSNPGNVVGETIALVSQWLSNAKI